MNPAEVLLVLTGLGMILAIPIVTIVAIVKSWRTTAVTLYLLTVLLLLSLTMPAIGRPRPSTIAGSVIRTSIAGPYEKMIDHIAFLSQQDDKSQLVKAIDLLKKTPQDITGDYTTRFEAAINAMIAQTSVSGPVKQ